MKIMCINHCGVLGTILGTCLVLNKHYQLPMFSECSLPAGPIGDSRTKKENDLGKASAPSNSGDINKTNNTDLHILMMSGGWLCW